MFFFNSDFFKDYYLFNNFENLWRSFEKSWNMEQKFKFNDKILIFDELSYHEQKSKMSQEGRNE